MCVLDKKQVFSSSFDSRAKSSLSTYARPNFGLSYKLMARNKNTANLMDGHGIVLTTSLLEQTRQQIFWHLEAWNGSEWPLNLSWGISICTTHTILLILLFIHLLKLGSRPVFAFGWDRYSAIPTSSDWLPGQGPKVVMISVARLESITAHEEFKFTPGWNEVIAAFKIVEARVRNL